ncbi:hypothetical protein [Angustibacter luteus]|uniref:DUF4239 domain-containing protein n=1 Tax=Angustibacter luteus TaxID=658456 RepID=A0ABW1JGE7_9ACTN
MVEPADAATAGRRNRAELLATVLLVVAAVATSWSSYQAARWHGEQAAATSRTSAIRIQAARADSLADSQTQVDVATFIAWADADQRGDAKVADFYVDRFRPEFKTAFEAWLATDPLTSPGAAKTPFAMPSYAPAARATADKLDAAAEVSAAEVTRDIQRASNYVLTVVLYSVALFFAGMSTKIRNPLLRLTLVGAGCAVLLGTLVWVATFPISLKV